MYLKLRQFDYSLVSHSRPGKSSHKHLTVTNLSVEDVGSGTSCLCLFALFPWLTAPTNFPLALFIKNFGVSSKVKMP